MAGLARPSHFARYIVLAVILLTVYLYVYKPESTTYLAPSTVGTSSGTSSSTNSKQGAADGSGMFSFPGSSSSSSSSESSSGSDSISDSEGINPYSEIGQQQPLPPVDDTPTSHSRRPRRKAHPIDDLIKQAESDFHDILAKESTTLESAAQRYRERRGRHPPPGFDVWHQFARDNKAVIVEDFFDQIYHDLNPFWAMDPRLMRNEAARFEMTINVRNGNASAESDWFWTQIWLNMTQTIEHLLPDMDLALNPMDEPRIVAPWETINEMIKQESETRSMPPADEVIRSFDRLPPPKELPKEPRLQKKTWERTHPFWPMVRRGCPPDSPARQFPIMKNFDHPPEIEPQWADAHSYHGFVSNYTLSTSICHQPDLQGLEGIFIHPMTTASTQTLFPMFGGSKLATNNEILLPAPMYWNEEERFTGGDDHGGSWSRKIDGAVWRGVSTGGNNKQTNWRGFQRHRFVSMNNATKVSRAEQHIEPPVNFRLPESSYKLGAYEDGRLGHWLAHWSDVGFTHLSCDDDLKVPQPWGHCFYTDEHYDIVESHSMAEEFDYKFLPDIDGNSFSGRYLGFLRSTSLPIKSTLWREWHDSRLMAWKHFVPMDSRFSDWYSIMEYFLGYEEVVGNHDVEARKIAMNGKAWADKVLRKEDMQIYTLRLLLEYARVSNDKREYLGFVDDLIKTPDSAT